MMSSVFLKKDTIVAMARVGMDGGFYRGQFDARTADLWYSPGLACIEQVQSGIPMRDRGCLLAIGPSGGQGLGTVACC